MARYKRQKGNFRDLATDVHLAKEGPDAAMAQALGLKPHDVYELGDTPAGWLRANDLAREAAWFCVVQMNVLDLIAAEVFLKFLRHVHSLTYAGGHHHVRRVIGADGHETSADVTRDFPDAEPTLPRAAAHKDRPGCAVG